MNDSDEEDISNSSDGGDDDDSDQSSESADPIAEDLIDFSGEDEILTLIRDTCHYIRKSMIFRLLTKLHIVLQCYLFLYFKSQVIVKNNDALDLAQDLQREKIINYWLIIFMLLNYWIRWVAVTRAKQLGITPWDFRPYWRVLDGCIVILYMIDFLGTNGNGLKDLSWLKSIVVLRMLRLFNHSRLYTNAIVDSIKDFMRPIGIYLLYISIFAIYYLNEFKGVFRYQCGYDINGYDNDAMNENIENTYLTVKREFRDHHTNTTYYIPVSENNQFFLCHWSEVWKDDDADTKTTSEWFTGISCEDYIDIADGRPLTCLNTDENIDIYHFDNYAFSWLSIFQMMQRENWSKTFVNLRSNNNFILTIITFVMLSIGRLLLQGMILANLINFLVPKLEKVETAVVLSKLDDDDADTYNFDNCFQAFLKNKTKQLKKTKCVQRLLKTLDTFASGGMNIDENSTNSLLLILILSITSKIIFLVLFCSLLIMGSNSDLLHTYEPLVEMILSILLLLETIITLCFLSMKEYFKSLKYRIDFANTMIGILFIIDYFDNEDMITAIPYYAIILNFSKLLRTSVILSRAPLVNSNLKELFSVIKGIVPLYYLLFILLVLCTVITVERFEEHLTFEKYPDFRFDALRWGFIQCFIILTNDGWREMLNVASYETGTFGAGVIFIITIIVGSLLFTNLFLAVMLRELQIVGRHKVRYQDKMRLYIRKLVYPFAAQAFTKWAKNVDMYELCQEYINKRKGNENKMYLNIYREMIQRDYFLKDDKSYANRAMGEYIKDDKETKRNKDRILTYLNAVTCICILLSIYYSSRNYLAITLMGKPFSSIRLTTFLDFILNMIIVVDILVLRIFYKQLMHKNILPYSNKWIREQAVNPYLKRKSAILEFFMISSSIISLVCVNFEIFGSKSETIYFFTSAYNCSIKFFTLIPRSQKLQNKVDFVKRVMVTYKTNMSIYILIAFIYGIIGMDKFSNKFWKCTDPEDFPEGESLEETHNYDDGTNVTCNEIHHVHFLHFDDPGRSMLGVLAMFLKQSWVELYLKAIHVHDEYYQPQHESHWVYATYYFIFGVFFFGFFFSTYMPGLVLERYVAEASNQLTTNLIDKNLKGRPIFIRFLRSLRPKKQSNFEYLESSAGEKASLFERIYANKIYKKSRNALYFIVIAIMCSVRCEETENEIVIRMYIFNILNIFFSIDLIIRKMIFRSNFFSKWSNILDTFLTLISVADLYFLINYYVNDSAVYKGYNFLLCLRVLRVWRPISLISKVEAFVRMIKAFQLAKYDIFNAFILLMCVCGFYAVVGVFLFQHVEFPEPLTQFVNFTGFSSAYTIIYMLLTGDRWVYIYEQLWSQVPDYTTTFLYRTSVVIFCSSFQLITIVVLQNLFLAAFLVEFDCLINDTKSSGITLKNIKQLNKEWAKVDPKATGYIFRYELIEILKIVPRPLGAAKFVQGKLEYDSKLLNAKLMIMEIDIVVNYQDYLVQCNEFICMNSLNNQSLHDKIERAINSIKVVEASDHNTRKNIKAKNQNQNQNANQSEQTEIEGDEEFNPAGNLLATAQQQASLMYAKKNKI